MFPKQCWFLYFVWLFIFNTPTFAQVPDGYKVDDYNKRELWSSATTKNKVSIDVHDLPNGVYVSVVKKKVV